MYQCYFIMEWQFSMRYFQINNVIRIIWRYEACGSPWYIEEGSSRYGLWKYLGLKRDYYWRGRKLHNAELHALYSSPNIIRNHKWRRLRWAGHVARMEQSRNAYRVLVGRSEGKWPSWRSRRIWEDNTTKDLKDVHCKARSCMDLAQDRDQWRAYVRAVMNFRVPWRPIN